MIQIAGSRYIRLGAGATEDTVAKTSSDFSLASIDVAITSLNLRLFRVYRSSVSQSIQYHLKQ